MQIQYSCTKLSKEKKKDLFLRSKCPDITQNTRSMVIFLIITRNSNIHLKKTHILLEGGLLKDLFWLKWLSVQIQQQNPMTNKNNKYFSIGEFQVF